MLRSPNYRFGRNIKFGVRQGSGRAGRKRARALPGQGAPGAAPGGGGAKPADNVVDAEFVDVDDKK